MNTPVSFEIAKLLKDKGFDIPTDKHYEHALTSKKDSETNDYKGSFGWKKGETNLHSGYFKNNYGLADLSDKNWYMCSAPTISEVVMWLYEKHEIWISVETSRIGRFNYRLFKKEKSKLITMPFTFEVIKAGYDYKSPTEAYEAAIVKSWYTFLELEKEQVGQRSEQLIGFLKDYQKSCELMHVSKIDAKNFVDHWNPF